MSGNDNLLKNIQTAGKAASTNHAESSSELASLMSDADYLRQSSALINEALQKGFDVLQLSNGDIVTTGTKTIVNTYSWDNASQKLAKAKAAKKESRSKKSDMIEESLED